MKMKKVFLILSIPLLFLNLYGDIDDNWEAYYAFENGMEDSIDDSSGSLENGAYIASGLDQDSLFLDGSDDYAELRDFDPTSGGDAFSVSFWTKSGDANQGNHCFIGKNSATKGNEFLIGYWSRLFQGGIVRRGISKVVVKLDPDGSLRSLKSKWPEFKENKAVEDKISYSKSINDLVDELANNNKAHLVGNMTTWEIDEYNLSGAAKAWIPVYDSNENVILIPSISYIVEVYFGEHLTTRILDYPLSETYINQFIKCDI